MKRPFLAVFILSISACATHVGVTRQRVQDPPAQLSQPELQKLAEQHCASCHQGSVSREKPAALSVFDLDHADWCQGLAAAQFDVFYQRMQGELDARTRARLRAFTEGAARKRAL
jgi:hypothetical protein